MGKTLLAEVIHKYLTDGEIFNDWFIESGKAYYFLFKKNLKVTNIQFAELIALIRYTASRNGRRVGSDLIFLSSREFKESIGELINSFFLDEKFPRKVMFGDVQNLDPTMGELGKYKITDINRYCADRISEIYYALARNIVVADAFFGSCAIYLPPELEIDIGLICAKSGYIHSCGKNIFIRNIEKTTRDLFIKSIRRHIELSSNNRLGIRFVVYSHEDFPSDDQCIIEEQKNGLDDIKVYIEKQYMKHDSLAAIVEEIKKEFVGSLVVHEPRVFREDEALSLKGDVDTEHTIWLITDRSIDENRMCIGNERYYICYEQLFKNSNQFHLFDENKPAWGSSTTIPHTLIGAMINIALPYCMHLKGVRLNDPFAGTGTTFLESLKNPRIKPTCSDIEELSGIMLQDNINFFTLETMELKELKQYLSNLRHLDRKELLLELQPIWKWQNSNSRMMSSKGGLTDRGIKDFRCMEYRHRLLHYMGFRVKEKYGIAIQRGTAKRAAAYINEIERLLSQLNRYIELMERADDSLSNRSGFLFCKGDYSTNAVVNLDFIKKRLMESDSTNEAFNNCDIREMEKKAYDLVITDPPYGFNMAKGMGELASLYKDMVKAILRSLAEDGQVVIALPDRSFSGRFSPYFTHKEIVLRQFMMQARALGKEIVSAVETLPNRKIFCAPFYWESERALRRSILHLRVRQKSKPIVN